MISVILLPLAIHLSYMPYELQPASFLVLFDAPLKLFGGRRFWSSRRYLITIMTGCSRTLARQNAVRWRLFIALTWRICEVLNIVDTNHYFPSFGAWQVRPETMRRWSVLGMLLQIFRNGLSCAYAPFALRRSTKNIDVHLFLHSFLLFASPSMVSNGRFLADDARGYSFCSTNMRVPKSRLFWRKSDFFAKMRLNHPL